MTILYQEDWGKYKNPIVDDQTKNKTWIDIAAKYRSMGVKHWYFPLALLQPELRNWDPFDPNLPEEIKLMMAYEMEENHWYFFREIQRVAAKAGGKPGYLGANRGNIAMFWSMWNNFITYVQQIRQTGKSLNTRSIVNNFHNVSAEGAQHILFTKGDLRKDEIKEYKTMRDMLPEWMYYIDKRDRDNQFEFTTMSRGNVTKSYVPQGDPVAANGVGRGTTPLLVTGDEVPFLDYASISIPSLVAATTAVFDEARRKGAFHGILYTTTAGDLSTDSGQYVYEMIKKKCMFFSEILFDAKNRQEAVEIILANSKATVPHIDISFNHLQLGYTNQWLKEKIGAVPASRDKIVRDYLGQWTFGSTKNPIPEKILNRIRDNINFDYKNVTENETYNIRYHRPIEHVVQRQSVMGLDLSNAIGRDCITGMMIDAETTETLMAFSISDANFGRFMKWLGKLFVRFPNFVLVPEAKMNWIPVLDTLLIDLPLLGVDPGRRIYSRLVDNYRNGDTEERTYRDYCMGAPTERKYNQYRNQFGFPTNSALRDVLYVDVLRQATLQSAEVIQDPVLIDELSGLVEKNNRIDHGASGHDDHVISWLMANWFLRYAKNIEHYGINPRYVLTGLANLATKDPKERVQNHKQRRLEEKIAQLEELLNNAKSPIEVQYYSGKIQSLKSELKTKDLDEGSASIAHNAYVARNRQVADRVHQGSNGFFSKGNWFGR